MNYQEFLKLKDFNHVNAGFVADLSKYPLFDYQKDITSWAIMRGKSAIFADTGLGKTIMQLVFADQVSRKTSKKVIILSPLAVKEQTILEAERFGIDMRLIDVINYEQIHNICADDYVGVVLDESSILKGIAGKMRKRITDAFKSTPYKLSCTATPSPNDFMELGTQSEFLGVMSQVEMLSMFFIHDGSETQKWRLKGHGKKKFFQWMATWAVFISKPSDLGYSDKDHDLPNLIYHDHIIDSGIKDGLFAPIAQGLLERNKARRDTIDDRVKRAAEIANNIDDQVLVWCHLNDEGKKLQESIHCSYQVAGADNQEHKTSTMIGFANGEIKKLITKPKIAGFGMNWQSCNQMIFVGLNDSWEQFYQAVRRCWRFGQLKDVHVHIVSSDIEGGVLANIKRKEQINQQLKKEMIMIMKDKTLKEMGKSSPDKTHYITTKKMESPSW